MAPIFDLVRDINVTKTNWALKVRVIRVYGLPKFTNPNETYSLEFISQDSEGDRIHASIKSSLIKTYKPLIEEGHSYVIRHFVVGSNDMKFKTTSHKYKINFMPKTHVFEIYNDHNIPKQIYIFKHFNDILNATNVNDSELFDVIGEVVAKDTPKTKEVSGRMTKLIDIEMEDLEKNRLRCTLWGDFVDEIDAKLAENNGEPVILLLQMCRAKCLNGVYRVCNTFHVTKMIINGSCDEVTDFRSKLMGGMETSSQRVSLLSSSTVYTVSGDLESGNTEIRTIDQLTSALEVGSFWVLATVCSIETELKWWYLACKRCPKKVNYVGTRFYCEKCDRFDNSGHPRFKIQMRVIDGTGNTSFLLWDKECTELIGKTAADLLDEINTKSDLDAIPIEVESLVDREVLFKVQVRDQNLNCRNVVYTVAKVTDNPNMISKYVKHNGNQYSDVISKIENTEVEDDKASSSCDEVTTPMKGSTTIDHSAGMLEGSLTKRSLAGELSSNVAEKKHKTVIKQEKE